MAILPTARQLEFQDWEFGIFIHFGIRTFYEGYRDWDGKPMEASHFNPTELDCEQWARTAALAGAQYMVFVAKHHDGFANWPSQYTDFSVANSPWKNGKGDVVREFTDACRKYGLKIGLYYSPAEHSSTFGSDAKNYDDYFINQISEILTGYGEIDMLWFDGCGSENHQYDWTRIIGEIRRMQPGILIFNMGDPDYRWAGNEAGIAPVPCWNVVDNVNISIRTERTEGVGNQKWLPAECDCMIRRSNWFYSDADEHYVKSIDELVGIYYYSVGRGANMLLNVGPDRRGLFPDKDSANLVGMGAELRRRFAQPLVTFDMFAKEDNCWHVAFEEPVLLDHIVLTEAIDNGERVRRFRIEARPPHGSRQQTNQVWEGTNIGHKAICRFPSIMTQELTIRILESDGEATLTDIRGYHAGS